MDNYDYDHIISLIYDASYLPNKWDVVLKSITEMTDSRSASLLYSEKSQADANVSITYNIPPNAMKEYYDTFGKIDPFFSFSKKFPIGVAASDSMMIPNRKVLEKSCGRYFYDFMLTYDLFHIGGATLFCDNESTGAIAVQRGKKQGPWPDELMHRLTKITPHILRAFRIRTEFMRLKSIERSLYVGLDKVMIGIILINGLGKTIYTNPVAGSILRQNNSIYIRNKYLKAKYLHEERQLNDRIQKCINYKEGINEKDNYSLGLHHPEKSTPLPLLITPVFESDLTQCFKDSSVKAIVFIGDPSTPKKMAVRPLMEVYELTKSEANIAITIGNGGSLDSYARNQNISIHTARTHLKSIFRKTNTNRQSELVKVLLSGPFVYATE